MNKLEAFNKTQLRKDLPEIRSGYKVRVWQKVKETVSAEVKAGGKVSKTKKALSGAAEKTERVQAFGGVVIAVKHGRGKTATFTVRKISHGVGVERTWPLHSPTIEKIEVLQKFKVRRAKLYYLRERKGKRARLKMGLEVPKEEVAVEEEVPEGTEVKKVAA